MPLSIGCQDVEGGASEVARVANATIARYVRSTVKGSTIHLSAGATACREKRSRQLVGRTTTWLYHVQDPWFRWVWLFNMKSDVKVLKQRSSESCSIFLTLLLVMCDVKLGCYLCFVTLTCHYYLVLSHLCVHLG